MAAQKDFLDPSKWKLRNSLDINGSTDLQNPCKFLLGKTSFSRI